MQARPSANTLSRNGRNVRSKPGQEMREQVQRVAILQDNLCQSCIDQQRQLQPRIRHSTQQSWFDRQPVRFTGARRLPSQSFPIISQWRLTLLRPFRNVVCRCPPPLISAGIACTTTLPPLQSTLRIPAGTEVCRTPGTAVEPGQTAYALWLPSPRPMLLHCTESKWKERAQQSWNEI